MQVLKEDQITGASFRIRTGNPTFIGSQDIPNICHIQLRDHAGGTWTLQDQAPDESWDDTDIAFDANGIKSFHASPEIPYRITGGTVGAKAWCTNVWRAEDP